MVYYSPSEGTCGGSLKINGSVERKISKRAIYRKYILMLIVTIFHPVKELHLQLHQGFTMASLCLRIYIVDYIY